MGELIQVPDTIPLGVDIPMSDNGTPDKPIDPDSWTPINLNTLPEQPPIQPTLGKVGDIGLVYPGKRHVFSGPQESAKTLAAYVIGIQVIRDGGILVLIDFEMGAYDARARLRDLGATDVDLGRLLYLEPDEPATQDRISLLITLSPDLVIVDAAAGAYDLQGLDDNKRADVERLTRLYVRTFWKNNIATIFLDHVTKDAETRGKYAIGSERKVGGADVHLGFEVITPISRGHTGLYKIVTHKDRGGYLKRGTLAELELKSDPDSHAITYTIQAATEVPEGQEWMPTKVMQKLSGLLEQQVTPVTTNALSQLAGGNRTIALTAISQLVRLGYATETAGPRNSKLLTHDHPFTILEWENQPPTPTGSDRFPLVPGTGHLTGSGTVPPLRGTGTSDGTPEQLTGSGWDWVDELTQTEHENEDPPGDLHDPPTTDLPL